LRSSFCRFVAYLLKEEILYKVWLRFLLQAIKKGRINTKKLSTLNPTVVDFNKNIAS
jgi:hypothetical protein